MVAKREFDTWQAELRTLDINYLQENGFTYAEEFLYARFCNTTDRVNNLLDLLTSLPQPYNPQQVKQSLFIAINMPNLKVLNQFDKSWSQLFFDAWARRGLYRIRER